MEGFNNIMRPYKKLFLAIIDSPCFAKKIRTGNYTPVIIIIVTIAV